MHITKPLSNLLTVTVFLTLTFFLMVIQPVHALTATKPNISELNSYIASVCKSDCVDGNLLLMAVNQAATEFSVNPITLLAIIKSESSFKHRAVNKSSGKSVGLSQVQVYWHKKKFTTKNYFDVFDNVRVGAIIYKDCIDRWNGSREKALWCYNGHQKAGMHTYVPKVMKSYRELSSLNLII